MKINFIGQIRQDGFYGPTMELRFWKSEDGQRGSLVLYNWNMHDGWRSDSSMEIFYVKNSSVQNERSF